LITLPARRVFRPDGSLRPGAVVLEGDRVAAVLDDPGPYPPDRTLAPGLVDLQVNGLGRWGVWAGDLAEIGAALAAAGTTSWCPTLTSRGLAAYPEWFAAHPAPAPGELGVHLEGPFLSPRRAGAHRVEFLQAPNLSFLARLPERVRVVTLAPELPGALEAVTLLHARRVTVALGHSDAGYDEGVAAAGAGAGLVTHVFNAMTPLHHRDPGLAGAALADDRLVPCVIGDGVHVHPAVLALVLRAGPAVLVSDAVATTAVHLEGGAARLPDGTLAGSVITLADAVRTAASAGVPLGVALAAATSTPAEAVGRADLGCLEPGARADVIAFGPSLDVQQVWVGGELAASVRSVQ
jgi:N-acetylglucosamine-6-phosphate deacetylase